MYPTHFLTKYYGLLHNNSPVALVLAGSHTYGFIHNMRVARGGDKSPSRRKNFFNFIGVFRENTNNPLNFSHTKIFEISSLPSKNSWLRRWHTRHHNITKDSLSNVMRVPSLLWNNAYFEQQHRQMTSFPILLHQWISYKKDRNCLLNQTHHQILHLPINSYHFKAIMKR